MAKKKSAGEKTVTEFMMGRYGYDEFSKFLIVLSMLLLVVTAVFNIKILYLVAILIMAFAYYRMGSKRIKARKRENDFYLNMIVYKLFPKKKAAAEALMEKTVKYSTFEKSQELGEDDIVYQCYKCRGCGQEIKLESGQGVVKVICPECGNSLVDRV